jgi:hypothetical protein
MFFFTFGLKLFPRHFHFAAEKAPNLLTQTSKLEFLVWRPEIGLTFFIIILPD